MNDVELAERRAEEAAEKYEAMKDEQVLKVFGSIYAEAKPFMDADLAAGIAHEAVLCYLEDLERDPE